METKEYNFIKQNTASMQTDRLHLPEQPLSVEDMFELGNYTTNGAHTNTAREGDKKKKAVLLLLILLLLGLLALLLMHQIGFFMFPWEQAANPVEKAPVVSGDLFPGLGDATTGMLSSMTKEEIVAQMQIAADENYFSFKINTMLVLENGQSETELGIENPAYNIYPMVVQINLGADGKGEMIYDSGGIIPDYHIDRAKFTKELPEGTYKALAHLYAYDPDTQLNVFKSTAELTIIVNG
jgi:hypothetical protein